MNDDYNAYMELVRENADLSRRISILQNDWGIAKEAIDRYCPPELQGQAREWLDSMVLQDHYKG